MDYGESGFGGDEGEVAGGDGVGDLIKAMDETMIQMKRRCEKDLDALR